MWIHRGIERRLAQLAAHFPAVLVTGARQTGKTALLQRVFPKAAFVSLDLPSVAHAAETSPGELLGQHGEPVILDEVQYAPAVFRHLKARIDARRHAMGRFLMSGSQRLQLMERASESLAGRCAVVELGTLGAAELRAAGASSGLGTSELIVRGGFPELHRDPELPAGAFFASYVATYLERDVRSALRVGSLRDFERFVRGCAARGGQLLNLAELARDVGIAATTAREWLSVLQASGIVVLLEPWFGNLGKRLVKAPKLYVRDTGLACSLLGIDTARALERSPFIGPLWETFVLHQMLCAREATDASAGFHFFRDAHGNEVDFVIEHEGELRLVEAKWAEEVGESGLASLRKVRAIIGSRGAREHWVACRTPRAHVRRDLPGIRFVNGVSFDAWV